MPRIRGAAFPKVRPSRCPFDRHLPTSPSLLSSSPCFMKMDTCNSFCVVRRRSCINGNELATRQLFHIRLLHTSISTIPHPIAVVKLLLICLYVAIFLWICDCFCSYQLVEWFITNYGGKLKDSVDLSSTIVTKQFRIAYFWAQLYVKFKFYHLHPAVGLHCCVMLLTVCKAPTSVSNVQH